MLAHRPRLHHAGKGFYQGNQTDVGLVTAGRYIAPVLNRIVNGLCAVAAIA